MALYAIGDVHGCAETLWTLLDEIKIGPDDHLVFIGDYIDRGPSSKAVIDGLLEIRKEVECTFLRGNHEELLLDYVDFGAYEPWRINGADTTLRDYPGRTISPEHLNFFRETQLYLDTPEYCFVHAGLRPELTVQKNLQLDSSEIYLWERSHIRANRLNWEKVVVCGHTPVAAPIDRDVLINIDTGCVYHDRNGYGRLTAVRLPDREFISVPYRG